MNNQRYDENIVTGFLAGGFGIMLYEVFKTWYGFLFVKTLSPDQFNKKIYPMVFAGFLVALFAVCYALITWRLRKKQAKKET